MKRLKDLSEWILAMLLIAGFAACAGLALCAPEKPLREFFVPYPTWRIP